MVQDVIDIQNDFGDSRPPSTRKIEETHKSRECMQEYAAMLVGLSKTSKITLGIDVSHQLIPAGPKGTGTETPYVVACLLHFFYYCRIAFALFS